MLGMLRHRDPATGYIKRRAPTSAGARDLDDVADTDSATDTPRAATPPPPPPASNMSAVDVFFLTFNCAKNLVNVPVFATHLASALRERPADAGLPDLVAL